MKNFIEVTTETGKRRCINVTQIKWFAPRYVFNKVVKGAKIELGESDLGQRVSLTVNESYDELVAKIEAATDPQLPQPKEYKNNVKKIDLELTGDITEANFLKTSIKCYEFDNVSGDWTDGWSSAIKWSLDKIDQFFGVQ